MIMSQAIDYSGDSCGVLSAKHTLRERYRSPNIPKQRYLRSALRYRSQLPQF